jgi:hypothetical protein
VTVKSLPSQKSKGVEKVMAWRYSLMEDTVWGGQVSEPLTVVGVALTKHHSFCVSSVSIDPIFEGFWLDSRMLFYYMYNSVQTSIVVISRKSIPISSYFSSSILKMTKA